MLNLALVQAETIKIINDARVIGIAPAGKANGAITQIIAARIARSVKFLMCFIGKNSKCVYKRVIVFSYRVNIHRL